MDEARAKLLAKLAAKRDAYVAIFGPPDKLKPEALIVLADLEAFCGTWKESIHMDNDGRMDPYTTIYRDGKKAVPLRIRKMIEWSEHEYSDSSTDNG